MTRKYEIRNSQILLFIDKNKQEGLNDTHNYMSAELDLLFTLIQAFRVFNLFGEIEVVSMVNELKQLDKGAIPGKKVIAVINPDLLLSSDKEKSMDVVNPIKKKINGTIKGRTCENGIK